MERHGALELKSSRGISETGGTILLEREAWRVCCGQCSSRLSG
jgi:hypothetical protein